MMNLPRSSHSRLKSARARKKSRPPVSALWGKPCAAARRGLAAASAAAPGTAGPRWSRSGPAPWTAARSSRRPRRRRRRWAASWRSPCWRWRAPTPPSRAWPPCGWLGRCAHTPRRQGHKSKVWHAENFGNSSDTALTCFCGQTSTCFWRLVSLLRLKMIPTMCSLRSASDGT